MRQETKTLIDWTNFSLVLFVLGMSMRWYSRGYIVFPYNEYESEVIRNLSFVMLISSLLCALLEGKLRNFQAKYRYWLTAVGLVFCILLIYGVFRENEPASIRYDLAAFSYFSGLLVASKRRNWKTLELMLLIHFFIGTIVNLYAFYKFPVSPLREEVIREYPPYLLQSLFYPWPYFLMTFYRRGIFRKIVVFTGLATVFLSFIFVQKRLFIFDFLFLTLLAIYFYAVKEKIKVSHIIKVMSRVAVFLVVFICVSGLILKIIDPNNFVSKSAEGLKGRMFQTNGKRLTVTETFSYANFRKQPRFVEAKYFFDNASTTDVIFGRGIGGKAYTPGTGETFIHIGFATLILKGGIILLVLWLSGWFMILGDYFKGRKSMPYIIGFALAANYLIRLSVGASWDSDVWFGLFLLCTGPAMSRWVKTNKQFLPGRDIAMRRSVNEKS